MLSLLEHWKCWVGDDSVLVAPNYFETNGAPDRTVVDIESIEERMTSKQSVGIIEVKPGKRPTTRTLDAVDRSCDHVHEDCRTITRHGGGKSSNR
jgi:hypothetical protein